MSKQKRKPSNRRAQIERACRALVSVNHVCVVNIDPSGKQGLINYKSVKNIAPGHIGNAICDVPHQWTIYLAVMCVGADRNRYTKSIEVYPQGNYLARHLEEVIEHCYKELTSSANPAHVVASGWIAIPKRVTLEEEQAARIFEAVGAWNQVKVEKCEA